MTLSAGNDLSVNEGQTHTYSYTICDPGATRSRRSRRLRRQRTKVARSDTNTDTTGSFECTFPDGPASSTVSAQATDSDGAAGNTATQTVTVANVAPTVTLATTTGLSSMRVARSAFPSPTSLIRPRGTPTAGFHYAYACDNSSLSSATYAGSGTAASKSCTFGDNGSKTVPGSHHRSELTATRSIRRP